MTAKLQTEILMNELLGFAEKMLSQHGEFHPFGGYLKSFGEIVHLGVQSSRENRKAQQKVETLIESFRQVAAQGSALAFGVVADVRLPNAGGSTSDAIKFLLEHQDGYCAEVFFRYSIDDGNVQIIEVTAQQGVPTFFVMR